MRFPRSGTIHRYGFTDTYETQHYKKSINPLNHGVTIHGDVMKTQRLRQALDLHQFGSAFGRARRNEKSLAKEHIFSFRTSTRQ